MLALSIRTTNELHFMENEHLKSPIGSLPLDPKETSFPRCARFWTH